MSGNATGRWDDLIGQILTALTKLDAALAASDLVDEVVPGAAALSVESANVVARIRSISGFADSPNRATLLGVLLHMATWSTSWERSGLGASVRRAEWAAECAARRELAAACDDFAYLAGDPDPETRSLLYLLVGQAAEPAEAWFDWFLSHLDREPHEQAHACATDGIVRLAARFGEGTQHSADPRIRNILGSATTADLSRVRAWVNSNMLLPSERDALVARLGASVGLHVEPQDVWDLTWPTESP